MVTCSSHPGMALAMWRIAGNTESWQVAQSKHVVPTHVQNKPLFGSGMDRVLPHLTGDEFAHKAKQDGRIIAINERVGLVTIEYKDGTRDVIDMSEKQSKNVNTGYWITNKLDLKPGMKIGSKFEEGDILAYNSKFFKLDPDRGGLQHMPGKLARVAIAGGPFTHEDGSLITQRLSNNLVTDITMEKVVDVSPKISISQIVKTGDKIQAGDPLMSFQESETDVGAKFIEMLGDSIDDIAELSNNQIISKVSGEIVNIRVMYTEDITEFNESLQKIIKTIEKPRSDYNRELKRHFTGIQDDVTDAVKSVSETYEPDVFSQKITENSIAQNRRPWDANKKYSWIMLQADSNYANELVNWASRMIDPDDLQLDHEYDIAFDTHVTLGSLVPNYPDREFQGILETIKPPTFKIGKLTCFKSNEYDVLIIEADDVHGELSGLRHWLFATHKYAKSFEEYRPHITVAYLKPGTADKYTHLIPPDHDQFKTWREIQWSNSGVQHISYHTLKGTEHHEPPPDQTDLAEGYLLEDTVKKPNLPDSANVEFSGRVSPNTRIAKGRSMRGLRFVFYVRFEHRVDIGDKLAYYAALKSVVSEVVDQDEEPYYIDPETNEKILIDAVTSPLGVLNRKTSDIVSVVALGQLLVESKRKLSRIADKNNFKHKLEIL